MKKFKLSEIAKIEMGQSPQGNTCNEKGEGMPLLNGPTEFTDFYPIPTQYTTDGKRFSEAGEILFCVRGSTTGRMNWSDRPYAIGRGLASLSHKEGKEYNYFLKYLIHQNLNSILKSANGSTFPNLTADILASYEFSVPELTSQLKISSFLSLIDSKIGLNNRINAELEAMAKTIYDYWFVQFDFPNEKGKPYKTSGGKMEDSTELKREIPKGWSVKKIEEFGEFKNGINYDPSVKGDTDAKIINVRNISSSNLFVSQYDLDTISLERTNVNNYLVTEKDILIARSGIPGATRMMFEFAEDTIYCGFIIRFQVKSLSEKNYLFYFLKDMEKNTTSKSGGTIMPNVNQDTLKRMLIVQPDKEMISRFNSFVNPIFANINTIIKENQKLAELRDWLLPMLMNGQVKVKSIKERESAVV